MERRFAEGGPRLTYYPLQSCCPVDLGLDPASKQAPKPSDGVLRSRGARRSGSTCLASQAFMTYITDPEVMRRENR